MLRKASLILKHSDHVIIDTSIFIDLNTEWTLWDMHPKILTLGTTAGIIYPSPYRAINTGEMPRLIGDFCQPNFSKADC